MGSLPSMYFSFSLDVSLGDLKDRLPVGRVRILVRVVKSLECVSTLDKLKGDRSHLSGVIYMVHKPSVRLSGVVSS